MKVEFNFKARFDLFPFNWLLYCNDFLEITFDLVLWESMLFNNNSSTDLFFFFKYDSCDLYIDSYSVDFKVSNFSKFFIPDLIPE